MSGSGTGTPVAEQKPLVLPAWSIGVPAVLLLGFLGLFGRAGVGIQVLGLPLGAYLTPFPIVLVVGLIATARGRRLLQSFDRPQRRVTIAVAVAVAAGLLRAAAQGAPTLLRFQDLAYLLHLPWIVVGMAAMKTLPSDEERTRVLRWLAWTFVVILALHWARGVIAPVEWLFEQIVSGLEGLSDKPGNLMKDGDRALYGIALAALAVHLSGSRARSGIGIVSISGLLIGTQLADFSLGGSRGALLGLLLGTAVLTIWGSSRTSRRVLLTGAALSFALTSAVVLASVPDTTTAPVPAQPGVEMPPATTPPAEPFSLRERYEIGAGRRAVTATVEQLWIENGEFVRPSEVSWRIGIWTDVIREWNSSWRNRLFGIGFGTEIEAMTVPGRQGYDGLNRSVHSIIFTVLARQGLIGVAALSALLLALTSPRQLRWPVVTPILLTAMTVGLFDAFLEGVHAPITLWVLAGLASAGRLPRLPPTSTEPHPVGRDE